MEELARTMNFCNMKKGNLVHFTTLFTFAQEGKHIEQSQHTNFAKNLMGNFGSSKLLSLKATNDR